MDERNIETDHDPDPADLEVDAANEAMGGPTTESHSAGLTSELRPAETAEDGNSKLRETEERAS